MVAPATTALRDEVIFRVARQPWQWRPWSTVDPADEGNRWDDPLRQYRVLYVSSSRLGAFIETLAAMRAGLTAYAKTLLALPEEEWPTVPAGTIDASWRVRRQVGQAELSGTFVEIAASATIASLRPRFAAEAASYGFREFDASALHAVARPFTQAVSRFFYEQRSPDGAPAFAGISYRSRYGDEFRNWAIFERPGLPAPIAREESYPIDRSDPDFQLALERLRVRLIER